MTDTEKRRAPGRPRRFDPEQAVATAQGLFHARGYDAVSVAELTDALGIKPPSFYAAFGAKTGLYERVLDRYAQTGAVPLPELLRDDRPVAECLGRVLEEAARRYSADPDARGCLVLEGARSNDPEAREAACGFRRAAEAAIHAYVARRRPEAADRATDFMVTVMSGLSASARIGHDLDRLLETARLASLALEQALPD